jgi:hypothetical protein
MQQLPLLEEQSPMMQARNHFLQTLPPGAPTTARVDAEDGHAFYAGFTKYAASYGDGDGK